MSERNRTVAVYRNREVGFQEFTVPENERTTVLDALEYIRARIDPDLMYRHSCHHGSCGTCGCAVDGKFVLSCLTRLGDLEGDVVRVEPLPTMDHIGDLAVDPTKFFEEFPEGLTYLRPSEVNAKAERPEDVAEYTRFENCIECGLCVSTCPVTADFTGPAALAAIDREIEKHPEREDEMLDLADGKRGAAACERALNCSRVCPTGVYPAKHIAFLNRKLGKRRAAEKE